MDEDVFYSGNDVYDSNSWHHAYSRMDCINHNVTEGKVLILGDSYDSVTHCFLSLGIREVDSIIRRNYAEDYDVREKILENGYDTVIIAYAQFMVGGHDDPTSSSYLMFTFDGQI